VGAGAFGRFSIEAYRQQPDIEVLAVADVSAQALAAVSAPGVRLERDWRRLVADQSIEVIHVVTPPRGRREIVDAAVDARKSVFCEKPLALTLAEADDMIASARKAGVALGVDYVMRFQPAYRFLFELANSGLAGAARSLSFQNFAQGVPAGHWFWDRAQSGGILVEHGVHFFDCYGRVAGMPVRCAALKPRERAIEVTLWYDGGQGRSVASEQGGVVGRYFHEFAFPAAVELATGAVMFERGHLALEGWIPTRISGAILAGARDIGDVARTAGVELEVREAGDTCRFEARFPDREGSYASAVVAGIRDVVRKHRDPEHRMTVPVEAARLSLAVALAAQTAADRGTTVRFDDMQANVYDHE
jgi:predicted dehydrogenase